MTRYSVGIWFDADFVEAFADDGFGNLIRIPGGLDGAAVYHPYRQEY